MEIGKSAKKMGHQHPRVVRRTDPVPARATPAAKPHPKAKKPFGFSYEYHCSWRKDRPWHRRYEWFETDRAASQALQAFARKYGQQDWYRDLRPEVRLGGGRGGA